MGTTFIVSALEIDKGKTPDWQAARTVVAELDNPSACSALLRAFQADDMDDIGIEAEYDECREKLMDAIKYMEDNWDEHSFDLRHTTLFVFAGSSWGDSVNGANEMAMFIESGAAKAAGFLV